MHPKPAFGAGWLDEIERYKTDVYIPGIISKKDPAVSSQNFLMISPSSLPQSGSGPNYGIGKLPDLVRFAASGNIILKNWNEPRRYAGEFKDKLGDPIELFAGDTLTINWKDIIEEFKITNIGAAELEATEKEKLSNRVDRDAVKSREKEIVWKIFLQIVNFEEYKSFIKNFSNPGNRDLMNDVFGNMLILGDLDSLLYFFKLVYRNDPDAYLARAEIAKTYYEEFNKRVLKASERPDLYAQLTAYTRSLFNNNWFRSFVNDKSIDARITGDEPEAELRKKFDSDWGVLFLLNYMMQMFYSVQMREVIKRTHDLKGKIYFDLTAISLEFDKPALFQYLFNWGFDGAIIHVASGAAWAVEEENFKDNVKALNFQMKTPQLAGARIFMSAPVRSEAEKAIIENTDFGKVRFLSTLGQGAQLGPGEILIIDTCPRDFASRQRLITEAKKSGARDIAIPAAMAFNDDNYEYLGKQDMKSALSYRLPVDADNRKGMLRSIYDQLTPIITGRPVSPDALGKIGYNSGTNFSEVPELTEEYLSNSPKGKELFDFSFDNSDVVAAGGLLGLMKAVHNLKYGGGNLLGLIKQRSCLEVTKLILNSVRNTPGFEEMNWKAGWLKLRSYEKEINLAVNSDADKAGYVVEMFGFLRGIFGKAAENNYNKNVPEPVFEHEYDNKAFRGLIALKTILGIDGKKNYETPHRLSQEEPELDHVESALFSQQLQSAYERSIFTKLRQLPLKNSAFTILFVNALLNLKELVNKNPNEDIALPQTKELYTDQRLREMINPVLAEVIEEGAVTDLVGEELEDYEWAVSELSRIFEQLAERRKAGLIAPPFFFSMHCCINSGTDF